MPGVHLQIIQVMLTSWTFIDCCPLMNNQDKEDAIAGLDGLDDMVFDSIILVATSAAYAYAEPLFNKIPYHTSSLSGLGWVCELLNGHPE